jgi:hypothetical protein
MSEIEQQNNKKIKDEKQKSNNEKNFYDYIYWREVQRNQLGISANLYFIFSASIFGFTIKFLIDNKNCLNCVVITLLLISLTFLILSLYFFTVFTENRLKDFRETAKLINDKKNKEEIKNATKNFGINTWSYYNLQRYTLFLGFIFSIISFLIYIFS